MNDPEVSWEVWKLLEQTGWEHLPYPGGLLDQPEALYEDLMTIAWRKGEVEKMLKPGPGQ